MIGELFQSQVIDLDRFTPLFRFEKLLRLVTLDEVIRHGGYTSACRAPERIRATSAPCLAEAAQLPPPRQSARISRMAKGPYHKWLGIPQAITIVRLS